MGSTIPRDPNVGKPINKNYREQREFTTEFEAAERMAEHWGITRTDTDGFAKMSQDRAATAINQGKFAQQVVPVEVPVQGEDGKPTGDTVVLTRDECPRDTTLEALAKLAPSGRPDGVHTAGTSSQIADGASALLLMSRQKSEELGVDPIAQIVDVCWSGVTLC